MAGDRYPIEMVNGVPVVAAPAEVDASNADWLRAVLLEAAACGHGTFVVDMSRTQFCASAGVGVLVRAHSWALADGGKLRLVVSTSASVLRVFELTGIDQVIPNFPSLYEAMKPAPAAAPSPPQPRRRRRPKPGMRTRGGGPPPDSGASASTALRSPRSGARLVPWPVPHRPAARRRIANTAICPAGPPPACSRAAWAGRQSHSTHDTVIRPGPHSCPFWQPSGSTTSQVTAPTRLEHVYDLWRLPSRRVEETWRNLASAWSRRAQPG